MSTKYKILIISSLSLFAAVLFFNSASALKLPNFIIEADHLPVFAGEQAEVMIVTLDPSLNLASTTFDWYLNGVYQSSASGLGKSALRINSKKDITNIEVLNLVVRVNAGPEYDVVERNYPVVIMPLSSMTLPGSSGSDMTDQLANVKVNFEIDAFPETPSPGETVKLSIDPFGFDIDTARVQWVINGKNVLSGTGEDQYELEVGDIGESYKITATITLPDGTKNTRERVVKVALLSLYWWADTYVPPWYKGKALPTARSKVTFLALPKISKTGTPPLVYNWKLNDSLVDGKRSGLGKSTFIYSSMLGIPDNISVEIKSIIGGITKEFPIRLRMVEPTVGIYELRPLEGVDFAKRLSSLEVTGGSIVDFIAEPFFVPLNSLSDIVYDWQLNGTNIPPKKDALPNVITVKSERVEGRPVMPNQSIGLTLENPKNRSMRTFANLQLIYR